MAELRFVQVKKENATHLELLYSLMVPYMAELDENDPDWSLNVDVFELTQGVINMQGPYDRHLELVYDGDSLIGFHYCKVDHAGHRGFIKPEYRRKGYGRRIFATEETLFNLHGTRRMYLNADPKSGLPFWQAMGFIGTGEIQPHNKMEIYEKEVKVIPAHPS